MKLKTLIWSLALLLLILIITNPSYEDYIIYTSQDFDKNFSYICSFHASTEEKGNCYKFHTELKDNHSLKTSYIISNTRRLNIFIFSLYRVTQYYYNGNTKTEMRVVGILGQFSRSNYCDSNCQEI